MRLLIDGYNVMFAAGLMQPKFGPNGLRHARTRFLERLATLVDSASLRQTTVVFDAVKSAERLDRATAHKGITVLFAVGDATADDRIERIIQEHPNPKALTVVSSDHRVIASAKRRKAKSKSADDFMAELEARAARLPFQAARPSKIRPIVEAQGDPRSQESAEEKAQWLRVFQDVADDPTTAGETSSLLLTDAEIAELEREIDAEDDA